MTAGKKQELTPQNVLLPSTILNGGQHYTLGVFWLTKEAPVDPVTVLKELESLDIRGQLDSRTDNWFWLVIEPKNDIPTGQLVLLGTRVNAIFGVWDYTSDPEISLDLREFISDVHHSAGEVVGFIGDHWLALSIGMVVALVAIFLFLRRGR